VYRQFGSYNCDNCGAVLPKVNSNFEMTQHWPENEAAGWIRTPNGTIHLLQPGIGLFCTLKCLEAYRTTEVMEREDSRAQ
jgi:hypothetical protein